MGLKHISIYGNKLFSVPLNSYLDQILNILILFGKCKWHMYWIIAKWSVLWYIRDGLIAVRVKLEGHQNILYEP